MSSFLLRNKLRGIKPKEIKNNLKIENLDLVDRIEIIGGGNLLFNFRINRSDHYWNAGAYKNYKREGTKSFLTFLNKNNFLRSIYIPLSFQLKEEMRLYIQFKNKKRVKLGAIQALDSYNKFFTWYSDYITTGVDKSYTRLFVYLPMIDQKIKERTAKLFIENNKLGKLIYKKFLGKRVWKFIPERKYKNT
ncbi:MAG: hypothetical protein OXJ52_04430, partial [Oligoflexia bacterium]|nr:hypothetical protein [Oligoflexia bacterium]